MAERGLLVLLLVFSAVLLSSVVMGGGATGENDTCTLQNPTTGEVNFSVRGVPGPVGPQGPQGASGPPGLKGEQGPIGGAVLSKSDLLNMRSSVYRLLQGEINSTVQTSVESAVAQSEAYTDSQVLALRKVLDTADANVLHSVMSKLSKIEDKLAAIELRPTKCGITGPWRKVAYLNTAGGDPCPAGLNTHTNSATNQRACGRSVDRACSSVQFPTGSRYSQVCGRVRGYQDDDTEPFQISGSQSINSAYLDGVSITHGSPRQHLWSYVSGEAEKDTNQNSRCPCARSPINSDRVPTFVGNNYYCESGFKGRGDENRIAWEDPLWDGVGCTVSGNQCCNRFGWFHRQVSSTSEDIEVRWCGINRISTGDVLTDQLEIWVM